MLERVRRGAAGVRDYTVDIQVHFDVAGMRVPDAEIRVYHKRPNKTKLEPLRGFAVVPKGALLVGDPLAEVGERFRARVVGVATLQGRPAYHLRLSPREARWDAPIEAWVDRERWTLLKWAHRTPDGDGLTVEFSYALQQGRFWLPARTVAYLRMAPPPRPPQGGPADSDDVRKPGPAGGSGMPGRAPRAGSVTITFRNFRVNTGLPDSLFQEGAKAPPAR